MLLLASVYCVTSGLNKPLVDRHAGEEEDNYKIMAWAAKFTPYCIQQSPVSTYYYFKNYFTE